jgi:hypothetical protein
MEVPPQTASSSRPKRRYTVSAKVLAANRRNLEKANAVPKEVRYRLTPKRLAACHRNLVKASTGHKAARPPRRALWRCRSLLRGVRRWGRNVREQLRVRKARVTEVLVPKNDHQAKLAQGIAEGFGRWMTLLRGQLDRERAGLLRIWACSPQDARSVAQLGCRLIALFRDEAWIEQGLDRLALRLRRLGRLFFEMQNLPQPRLQEALAETSADALGNPFRPIDSPRMAALLAEPAMETKAGPDEARIVLPELPAEQPYEETAENSQAARRQQHSGNDGQKASDSQAGMRGAKPKAHAHGRRRPTAEEWPGNFADYQALVEQSLGAGEEFAPLVGRIARLTWERHAYLAHECVRAHTLMEERVEQCYPHMPVYEMVEFVLEALTGKDLRQTQSQARKLEVELAEAFGEYLERRYGVRPSTHDEAGEAKTGSSAAAEDQSLPVCDWPTPDPRPTNPAFQSADDHKCGQASPDPSAATPDQSLPVCDRPTHDPLYANPVFESASEPQSPNPGSGNIHPPKTAIIGCGRPMFADLPPDFPPRGPIKNF